MKKKQSPSAASLKKANAKLALGNSTLKHKSNLLETTVNNSLSDLVSNLSGPNGLPQSNLTSINPLLQNNMYAPLTLMWQALMFAYRTHGLLQTMIDAPVLDALRGGLDLHSDQLGSDIGQVEDYIQEHGILDRITDTFIWARLFGGAALVINSEANGEEPLGDEVKNGGMLEFYDACRWELTCERRIPASGKYGFYGHNLDKSRVLTVLGKRAPYLIRAQLSDWGMSELERALEDFNVYLRGREIVYAIMDEAKVDVYSLEGFAGALATPNGTAITTRRIQTMNQIKNYNNALILDTKDTYSQKQLSFGGLSEILRENRIGVASALRMPVSKLFGIGATGFSSGADDLENYSAMVESEVRTPMRPILNKVLKLICLNLFGEEFDIGFQYKPLRILSAVEEENIKSSKTTRYAVLYDRLLMDSQEFGEALQKDNLVPVALKAEKGLLDEHPLVTPPTAIVAPDGEGVEDKGGSESGGKGGDEELETGAEDDLDPASDSEEVVKAVANPPDPKKAKKVPKGHSAKLDVPVANASFRTLK